jgi:hypothetical protein
MPALTVPPLLLESLLQLRQLLLVLHDILRHKPSLSLPVKTGLILEQSLLALRHREKLSDILSIYVLSHLLDVTGCPLLTLFDGRPVHGFGDGVGAVDFEDFQGICLLFVLFDV